MKVPDLGDDNVERAKTGKDSWQEVLKMGTSLPGQPSLPDGS